MGEVEWLRWTQSSKLAVTVPATVNAGRRGSGKAPMSQGLVWLYTAVAFSIRTGRWLVIEDDGGRVAGGVKVHRLTNGSLLLSLLISVAPIGLLAVVHVSAVFSVGVEIGLLLLALLWFGGNCADGVLLPLVEKRRAREGLSDISFPLLLSSSLFRHSWAAGNGVGAKLLSALHEYADAEGVGVLGRSALGSETGGDGPPDDPFKFRNSMYLAKGRGTICEHVSPDDCAIGDGVPQSQLCSFTLYVPRSVRGS